MTGGLEDDNANGGATILPSNEALDPRRGDRQDARHDGAVPEIPGLPVLRPCRRGHGALSAQAAGDVPRRYGLTIRERLAKADLNNAVWQRTLAISHAKLAQTYARTNDPALTRRHLVEGRAIIAALVAKFPDWAEWKEDLAWFNARIAALK